MTVEDVLREAEKVNQQVAKHNQENSKNEGIRIAKKQEIEKLFTNFNAKHGTQLSPDNTEGIETEYKNAVYGVHSQTKHLNEVMQAIQENDIKKVTALTGVDIAQDTIKMPRMNVDLEEMEKYANNTLEMQQQDTNLVSGLVGNSEQVTQVNEGVVTQSEEEAEQEQQNSSKDIQNMFKTKIAEGKANQQANQVNEEVATTQETVVQQQASAPVFNFGGQAKQEEVVEEAQVQQSAPKFNFGQTATPVEETPVQEEPVQQQQTAPNFSFGQAKQEEVVEETPVQEEQQVEEEKRKAPKFSFNQPATEEKATVQEEQTTTGSSQISFGAPSQTEQGQGTNNAPSFGQAFQQNKAVEEEKKDEVRKGKIQFNIQPKSDKPTNPVPLTGGSALEQALKGQGQEMPKFEVDPNIDIDGEY